MPHLTKNARHLRKNMTTAEKKLWKQLRSNRLSGLRFRRQVPLGNYIVDFACFNPKVIIELDGSQHGILKAIKYDENRTNYLESLGYKVFRFWNREVLQEINKVIEIIWHKCFSTKM